MRYIIISALIFIKVLTLPAQAVFSPIETAIKAGNSAELSKYLNQSVDITIDANQSTFDLKTAENLLNDFFKRNPPTDFDIVHTGSSKSGLKFAIGRYTSGNTHYSVLIRIKETGTTRLIHEISFVKE
jgi:hypothetical protein